MNILIKFKSDQPLHEVTSYVRHSVDLTATNSWSCHWDFLHLGPTSSPGSSSHQLLPLLLNSSTASGDMNVARSSSPQCHPVVSYDLVKISSPASVFARPIVIRIMRSFNTRDWSGCYSNRRLCALDCPRRPRRAAPHSTALAPVFAGWVICCSRKLLYPPSFWGFGGKSCLKVLPRTTRVVQCVALEAIRF